MKEKNNKKEENCNYSNCYNYNKNNKYNNNHEIKEKNHKHKYERYEYLDINTNTHNDTNTTNTTNTIKEFKKKLSGKEYLYRTLFGNHNTIMLLIDPDTGQILEANQAAVRYYGYTKDELLSKNIIDLNVSSPEQVKEGMLQAKSGQKNYFEVLHILANGEQREVEIHSIPIEIENKIFILSIIYDVSYRLHKELMFDTLFFNSPYAVVILDREQKIVNINKNFTNIFQYELHEVKGKSISQLVSSSENAEQIDNNLQLVYRGEVVKQEGNRRRKDGKMIDVEILGYPIISRQSIIGVYVIYGDISRKKAYEEQLLLFRKILENNTEGVVITDNCGNIEWVNAAFEEITGYKLSEIQGQNMNILKSGMQSGEFYKDMWHRLINVGKWSGEIWNKTKSGEIYAEWLTINNIRDNMGKITHYVGIFRDISEKKRIDRRINELQQKDILTGLYNRSYFLGLVNTYIKNCSEDERFSIIFIGIENFKEINNSLGHYIGDKLMIELSKRLKNLMKDSDYIISRYSSDEFAILCKFNASEYEMLSTGRVVLENIKYPFVIENTILNVTASIGISRFPNDGKDAETLIRRADIAMYKAKSQTEDKIFFYSIEMSKEIEERFHLTNLLVRAIPNNELFIYYQPIFNIQNPRSIVGMEALLRWENPVLGEIMPEKFIPLAEKTGLIMYIGEWVLEQVCKQINLWQRTSCKVIPVAVNISVKQLEQHDFSTKVKEIIERYNLNPSILELEITESVSSGDVVTIVKNLKELKRYGLKISMDDFGTGFSSLGQLDLFELDKLKIDKIFIDDLTNITKKQNLVKSIIALARSLELQVVAEGIETCEQYRYLKQIGCEQGQGYLFSKPLTPEEIEKLLK